MPTGTTYDVFLSYASSDQSAVAELAHRLKKAGIEPFLDKWHLVPGEPWQEALEEALDRSRTCAVFLGPGHLGPWQNEEMRSALERRVRDKSHRVIPVLLPGATDPTKKALPPGLKQLTWVEFRGGLDDRQAFHRLVCGIKGIPPGDGPAEPETPSKARQEKRPSRFLLQLFAAAALTAVIGILGLLLADSVKHWLGLWMCSAEEERTEAGIIFVRICPGTFTFGSASDPQASEDEKPAHQVTLGEFWIGKTEITNEQYRHFDPKHPGEGRLPATDVSWTEAAAACEHFGGRLPTEAEWEYAARANSQGPWTFGDNEQKLAEYAWYGESQSATPHPVATKKSNAWGLHDMHGNVWEWVADWYGPYVSRPQTDPTGPKTGEERVLRGGAFFNSPRGLRSAFRNRYLPSLRYEGFGFRCASSPRR